VLERRTTFSVPGRVTVPLVRPSYTVDGAAKLLTDGTSNAEGFEHRDD